MGLTTILTTILGLSTKYALVQNPYFQKEIGRLQTLLDSLPMSGVKVQEPSWRVSRPYERP
jgi:hypothetical protein